MQVSRDLEADLNEALVAVENKLNAGDNLGQFDLEVLFLSALLREGVGKDSCDSK